ncbi:cell division protein FtsX [Parabacteroides sp. FAFU027]|uniref:cell division protein FtsX n=1 Tax=Parabacteroides sp. FAFU027 TaxID=2922715 RepID=UPI001FAEF6A2|nr:permease-like cell division protein FtsX [Parabacteroides sp. FAFU027]
MAKKKYLTTSSFYGARITAIISSSLVLFLLGILVIMSLITKELSSYVKENIGFSVIIKDNITDNELTRIQKRFDTAPYVRSSELYSKEKALKELTEELGENPQDFLGSVPLMASVEIKLKSEYANNDSIARIEKVLRNQPYVHDIIYRKDLVQMVNDNMKRIGLVLLSVAAVLMLISIALLNNTIRLTIYSKRFLLNTMKLVGATHGFIRKPFILSNMLNGLLASVLAIGMLSGLLYYMSNEIEGLSTLVSADSLLISFGAVLVLGLLLSVICAFFSVNRYLRMKSENLYAI